MKGSLLALGFALTTAGSAFAQAEYKGKHFDVFGGDKATVDKRGKQCDEVAERFKKIFGLKEVKRGAVTLTPGGQGVDAKKYGAVWTFQWPESMGGFPGAPGGGPGMPGGDDMDPFTHELGHMILVHHVNDACADSLKRSFNGYGSYLKDWLDECFACIHEPEGMKNTRRQQIKQHVQQGDYIKLRELFEMNHPIGGHGGGHGGGLPGAGSGGVPGATGRMPELPGGLPAGGGGLPGGAPGGAPGGGGLMDANKFYVECLSVLEFLLDQYGEEFVQHVVATFQQAKNMDDALKTYKGKLKRARIAKDTEELERQWVAWVKGR